MKYIVLEMKDIFGTNGKETGNGLENNKLILSWTPVLKEGYS